MKGSTIRQKLSQVGTSQKELPRILDVKELTKDVCDEQNNQESQNNKNMYATQKIWATNNIEVKVKGLLREQHKLLASLCSFVGMTDPGLRKVFVRDTCNIDTLKKIAEFFSVPVAYFLPEDPKAKAEAEKNRELEFLRGKVAAYETAFRLLGGERGIDMPLTVV